MVRDPARKRAAPAGTARSQQEASQATIAKRISSCRFLLPLRFSHRREKLPELFAGQFVDESLGTIEFSQASVIPPV